MRPITSMCEWTHDDQRGTTRPAWCRPVDRPCSVKDDLELASAVEPVDTEVVVESEDASLAMLLGQSDQGRVGKLHR